jgi:hypothetical protein
MLALLCLSSGWQFFWGRAMKKVACYASALFFAVISSQVEATTFSTDAFITNFDVVGAPGVDDNKQDQPTPVISHAEVGSATATAISSGGHLGVATQYAGNVNPGGGTANFATTVIFTSTNPNITTTSLSLNLAISGLLSVGPLSTSGGANASWNATAELGSTIYSYGTSLDTSGGVNINGFVRTLTFTSGGEQITGTIGSISDQVGGILTTGTIPIVSLNTPIFIKISLDVEGFGNPGGVQAGFLNSLDYPIGMGVFNLDDGVTANDPGTFLFNNLFLPPTAETPLPAAFPLFATGLGALGFLGWRRKRKQAA